MQSKAKNMENNVRNVNISIQGLQISLNSKNFRTQNVSIPYSKHNKKMQKITFETLNVFDTQMKHLS